MNSHLFLAGIDAFGSEADINHHASLTKQSRELKLQLNGDKTNQRTNELIEATERAGSLCTRIMGASGGGFFVCWAPKHKHQDIKESVKVKTWVDVKFSRTGSQVIFLNSLMYSNITSLVSILTSQDFSNFDSWSKSIASYIESCHNSNSLITIFGNGGSAADAQHWAAELVCTYKNRSRAPFPALALTTDVYFNRVEQ